LCGVELVADGTGSLGRVKARLHLRPAILHNVRRPDRRPHTDNYGEVIHIRVDTIRSTSAQIETIPLDFIIGENLIITIHPEPVEFLEAYDRRTQGDTQLGKLDAAQFLASLLDWHVSSYFRVVEEIGAEIDKLDEK